MSIEEREVIVVGAGPAGSTAAADLARRGHDVLLLDRQQFPRDKACGDAVPAGAIEILRELGMQEDVDAAVARGEFYELTSMRLVSPREHVLEVPFHLGQHGAHSYVAPRIHFDAVVKQGAVKQGAEFRQAHVKEPLIENGRIAGVRARVNGSVKDIRARAVIGADGVTSVITRHLRPKDNQHVDRHRAVALRTYVEDLEEYPHQVEFYLYEDILPGYAWIFPTGPGRANIGLGMRLDHFRQRGQSLDQLLQRFLQMPDIKKRLREGGKLRDVATWQLNFGSQKQLQHAYDGALLIGDAAGFINPLTGGGIHNAMVSAQLASETIHDALTRGDVSRATLLRYEEACNEAMWEGMRRSYFLQRWLMRLPFMIDIIIRWAGTNSTLAKTFVTKL